MTAVTICISFGAQENKACLCSHCFPISLPWSDGTGCHDLRQSHPPLWTCIYTVVCVLLSQLATAWNALPLLPSVPLNCVTQALCLEKPSLTPFSTFFIKLQCLVLSGNPRNNYWIRDTGALYKPRGVEWGGRWEGGSKGAIYVYLWLIHVEVWQKKTKFCKAVILQKK